MSAEHTKAEDTEFIKDALTKAGKQHKADVKALQEEMDNQVQEVLAENVIMSLNNSNQSPQSIMMGSNTTYNRMGGTSRPQSPKPI